MLIQALELKEQHSEQKQLYLEYKNIKKVLLRHIQDVIKDKYIKSLVDEYMNLLTDNIFPLIQYLFCNYGKVCSEEIAHKESKVMGMT